MRLPWMLVLAAFAGGCDSSSSSPQPTAPDCQSDDACAERQICTGQYKDGTRVSVQCVPARTCTTSDECEADETCQLRDGWLDPQDPTRKTCEPVLHQGECIDDGACGDEEPCVCADCLREPACK